MICDMLDRQFIRYVAIDNSPQKAIEARNKGLPVFYGDITRPEVLKGEQFTFSLKMLTILN